MAVQEKDLRAGLTFRRLSVQDKDRENVEAEERLGAEHQVSDKTIICRVCERGL